MRKRFVIIAGAFALFVVSCKKDNEPPTVDPNVQNLAGTYKFLKIGVSVDGSSEEDVTRFILKKDCQKDNELVLNPDMTCSYVDAGTTCGSGNIDSVWSMPVKDSIIIADSAYWIRKFDGTNLLLNHTEVVQVSTTSRVAATYTEYYVKQ